MVHCHAEEKSIAQCKEGKPNALYPFNETIHNFFIILGISFTNFLYTISCWSKKKKINIISI